MKVLIVDDDRVLADILDFALKREGFEVTKAYKGTSGLELWANVHPDLIFLDVNLPGIDGFTLCEQIRKETDTPIIMLTVRNNDEDIVRGLELGADDYILKPFSPRELIARTYAVLRRASHLPLKASRQIEDLLVDPDSHALRLPQNEPVALTTLEGRLLDFLIENTGRDLCNDLIIDHIWGRDGGDRDMLRQLVYRLRRKIEPDPANPIYIKTIYGLGYRFLEKNQKEDGVIAL